LLTTGFQENITKMNISDKQVANVEVKKKRFEEIKIELTTEKSTLDKDISQLRNALSTNTTTQSVDRKTGQVTTKANTGNRKAFESQLKDAQTRKDNIALKIDALNDSITDLDVQVLNMESEAELGNELGAVKYVSEITGWDVKSVANIFILLIIFVFDPLAIVLVIATNQAFERLKPKVNIYGESKPEKEIWDRVTKLKEEGQLPPEPTEEEKIEEPTALANSQYRNEYDIKSETSIQNEIETIENKIQKIQKSGAIGRRIDAAIAPLKEKLKSLKNKDDNTINYM